ncbi:group II truncated hemoglobin [Chondromyces crocatus]|uniref:Globin n=1 Tax=Chondromyces crocatus TaxID=52 RepID=A0A0K1E7J6_CHOCO|nr:group II truncated hemoglobin [Chondromyces crocatus]AKT36856.1 globin [Chondromyces crocatus]
MSAPESLFNPFEAIGGEAAVQKLVEHFYDAMERLEPELTRLHECDEHGKISRGSRDRFALFLMGWLGGPQLYMERHGHPRLRMRHARVPVGTGMRDAWLRAMKVAMDEVGVEGELRAFLEPRFAEVADFLRNRPG